MRRRAFLGAAGLLAAGTADAAGIPPSRKLGFRVMRNGNKIGEHNCTFEIAPDAMTFRAEASIVVHLAGIPVFRYTHTQIERWRGGEFVALETRTNDDGTPFAVQVQRERAGLAVTSSVLPRYVAPAEALPMTHWNRAEVAVPKINPQKGDLLRPVVADRGPSSVATLAGMVPAHQYTFSGQAILDLWYDNADLWAGLAFLGSDQSRIVLERL